MHEHPYPHSRRPSGDEHATLVERVGPVCADEFFLLERDSLESYVLCTRLKWARFNLPAYDAVSPPASPNHEYREKHRPVDDTIRYVDRWNAVYGD
ncbi:hypothetical protein [Actinosynnema pretiosum]|uniref:hypothetical protein n=1 Tax=Actinosynnema pretiosum TaxID=42197 RepID=UPI0012FD2E63|nr:hypothetical protein [Actinosynnema pretiosum]